ncbi:MAG: DEAD/DEAH box helicase family protein [Oscillospiraceae bacterium]|nr:DEAD/DEAH box helicase family protein [Oscillospiraceae bacterium]
MKLKFKIQPFQTAAVAAVVDLFRGQEKKSGTFTIENESQTNLIDNGYGVGNLFTLTDEQILANMRNVQRRHNLSITNDLEGNQFCVEMETGTGKTYVYTKTIFELNRQYGFSKFIIVVPSVAIREGVYKSFEITKEHFAGQYDNAPCRFFIYNSAKLSDVRNFAVSTDIEIMIINIDAFKKSENIINQTQDKLNGETAMRYIQNTNPIVIIDEPQSVDNTDKAKEAIASLNPLCVLRYSATHKEKINLLYRLTPVDAYQMGLVKQIAVFSNQVANDYNKPYIRLVSVSNDNGFSAKIEIDKAAKSGKVERKIISIKPDADIFRLSGERELYNGYMLAGIDCMPGGESIEFTNGEILRLGKSMGDIDENIIKKAQIRRTIESHLDKEILYTEKGIKVLSLFFIDEVKKYRTENGSKGIYAEIFEECYTELLRLSKYESLCDKYPAAVNSVHNGYFSQDKKGNYKNTKGDTLDDYDTYNTIMRDKEWLLSFDCPLRFIFSHSALKEGWDNPNVFQVCTLIEQKSTFTCRQKVGRGLRLCVDQSGERIEDKNINVLHVMANESFAEFADTLQKEIENETGVKFGILDIGLFSGITYIDNENEKTLSYDDAQELIEHFEQKGYITKSGNIKEALKTDLTNGTLDLPPKFEAAREQFESIIKKSDNKPPIRDASKDVTVRLKKQVMLSPEFIALWDKIKQKTAYRVQIDQSKLKEKCIKALRKLPAIPKARIVTRTARINVDNPGVSFTETGLKTLDIDDGGSRLPDFLRMVDNECFISQSLYIDMLLESGHGQDFLNNPQLMTEQFIETVHSVQNNMEIDGIKYIKLDGEEYYLQEIFDNKELSANIDKNAVAVQNSVYDYIIYDSTTVEKPFAVALDNDPEVKMFFKIPDKFKIETPIGTYNPDWAVYMDRNGEQKLYFVLETKGTVKLDDLRNPERQKFICGERHFAALNYGAELKIAKNWNEFKINN